MGKIFTASDLPFGVLYLILLEVWVLRGLALYLVRVAGPRWLQNERSLLDQLRLGRLDFGKVVT